MLDRNSSFTTTATKESNKINFHPSTKDRDLRTTWGNTQDKKSESSNWGQSAKDSNWGTMLDEKTESTNWGQSPGQHSNDSNWSKTQQQSVSSHRGQLANEYNWGKSQTEKSEPSNWGQSAKSTDQDNQPKLPSLMPQRRKRARNSESGDIDTRDSGVCGAFKKSVTNIHASASAYVPTMNKG